MNFLFKKKKFKGTLLLFVLQANKSQLNISEKLEKSKDNKNHIFIDKFFLNK